MKNAHCGEYTACLVADLLALEWAHHWIRGRDRAAWDLGHRPGTRMNVKQSAA